MKRRKFLVGGTAALTGAGLLAGARGASSVESNREVRIAVEGDEDAYIGLEITSNGDPVATGDTVEFGCEGVLGIVVRNQTKETVEAIDFEPILTNDGRGMEVDYELPDDPIDIGETGTIFVDITCKEGNGGTVDFGYDIEVEGTSGETLIEAQRDSQLTVECHCIESAWAYFEEPKPLNDAIRANKWGWYTKIGVGDSTRPADLLAGAGNNSVNSGTHVGMLDIDFRGDGDDDEDDQAGSTDSESTPTTLVVDYQFADNVVEEEVALFVGRDENELAETNGAPGQFPYKTRVRDPKFEIDLEDEFDTDIEDLDEIVIAAHAKVHL